MYISIYEQHLLYVSAFYSFPFVHQLVFYFKSQLLQISTRDHGM